MKENSYTIEDLTKNTAYFVRVFAVNDAGTGTSQTASPTFAKPVLSVPGKPGSISVSSGDDDGELDVRWSYPVVPWHGIPCGGTVDSPDTCPTQPGGTLADSIGGDAITEYEVEYNEYSDFTGQDGGLSTTSSTSLTLASLTSGRLYYIRVLARNSVGSGEYCDQSGAACPSTGSTLSAYAG